MLMFLLLQNLLLPAGVAGLLWVSGIPAKCYAVSSSQNLLPPAGITVSMQVPIFPSKFYLKFSSHIKPAATCRFLLFQQDFMLMFPLVKSAAASGHRGFPAGYCISCKNFNLLYDIIHQILVPVETSDLVWCKNNLHCTKNIISIKNLKAKKFNAI